MTTALVAEEIRGNPGQNVVQRLAHVNLCWGGAKRESAKDRVSAGVPKMSDHLFSHVLTHTHPERSFFSGTVESAFLSRGSWEKSCPLRPVHSNPIMTRPAPPAAYAVFLVMKKGLLFLLAGCLVVEADVLSREDAIKRDRKSVV